MRLFGFQFVEVFIDMTDKDHMVPLVLLSMAASITTYVKESDWLLKNLHQSENG